MREGMEGKDITQWQLFLLGHGFYVGLKPGDNTVDGVFGAATVTATQRFQTTTQLEPDGVVGPMTFGTAVRLGLPLMQDDAGEQDSVAWPPKPNFNPPGEAARLSMFGSFNYTALASGEIRITDGWEDRNIVRVLVPELVRFAPKGVTFHHAAVPQLLSLFKAWRDAGLINRLASWDGSFVPRMIRGSQTKLSNHAFGSAFDINCDFNGLGRVPARKGSPGCVRELVPLANQHGFFWGGHYTSRPDGMHFEVAKLIGGA